MFIEDIIYDTGLLVSSQFGFEGAVEDGGEQGIQLRGSLDWLPDQSKTQMFFFRI
jgi:hypothetical protein